MSVGDLVFYAGIAVMAFICLFVFVGFLMSLVGIYERYWGR